MRTSRSMCSFVLLLIMAAVAALGQVYTGSIAGTVKDPSGAVVPDAKITVTDAGKGFKYNATSDASGIFTVSNLPPGTYTETVVSAGFNNYERQGIVIEVAGHVQTNISLQVAAAGQTVTVSEASAPMLQTEDATTGQTLNRTFINNLPLINRAVYDLAFLAPGVSQAPGDAYGAGNGIGNNFVSDGERNAQSDILIDGISTTSYEQNTGFVVPLYTPSVDAVQEFRVQQTNFSAEIGFSAGTVVNVVTRSGTNQFHGSAYEFWRNDILNANSFNNNVSGVARPSYHWNDFGGTLGGPIKKDRLFFFYDYEGKRTVTPSTTSVGVPDAAERQGNFGELCGDVGGHFNSSGLCVNSSGAALRSGQLFDPWSATNSNSFTDAYGTQVLFTGSCAAGANCLSNGGGSGGVRQAYIPYNNLQAYASTAANLPSYITPGVPGNLLNPSAMKIIQNFPLPNAGGTPGTTSYNPYDNYFGSAPDGSSNDQYDIKLDARLTDKDQMSVRFSTTWSSGLSGGNIFNNVWDSNTQGTNKGVAYSTSLNYTHTLSPTTLLSFTAGYDHSWSHTLGIAALYPGYSDAAYGLPTSLGTTSGFLAPPAFTMSGYSAENGNANIGGQPWSGLLYGSDVLHMLGSVAHTAGNHDLHIGAEMRVHRINFTQYGIPGGLYGFGSAGTSEYGGVGGDSMASFLTGVATGWSAYEIPASPATQNLQYAGFIQDNWHVNDRLTLNLGLRYDIDMPRTERYNRMSFFDPSAPSPIAGLVPASACFFCSNTNQGSLEYVGQNGYGRSPYKPYYGGIGPRFGFAYRFIKDTTIRGGYGIYYDPSKYGAAGTGSGAAGFLGYDEQTSFSNWTGSGNILPALVLGQPVAISPVIGNSQGVYTDLGYNIGGVPVYSNSFDKIPQEQSWSFGIERQLPWNVLIDGEYVGRVGHHLYLGGDTNSLNHITPEGAAVYTSGPTGASAMNATVPIPAALQAAIEKVTAPYSNPYWGGSWQQFDNYLPYPEFGVGSTLWGASGLSNVDPPYANSDYNAFQFKAEKRFSNGLQALFTYTFQKSIDDSSIAGSNVWVDGIAGGTLATIQDPNNLRLERSVSAYNIPQIAQVSFVYALPFGRGKAYGANWNRLIDGVLGGWQVNGIYRWDDGLPLMLYLSGGTSIPTYGSQRPNLPTNLVQSSTVGYEMNYFTNASGAQVQAANVQIAGTLCYNDPWIPCQYSDGTAPRTLPKNRAPGTDNVTASLFKQFPLWSEASKLEFGIESFNLFNHVQWAGPNTTVGSPQFGLITNQANSPRVFQLRAKLYF